MQTWEILFVALFIAACHFASPYVFSLLEKYFATAASFSGGLAISYVFLHLIPELDKGFGVVGDRIYFIALIGFALFFGLELIVARHQASVPRTLHFLLHMSVAFVYNGLTIYTLAMQLPATPALTIVFAISLGLHLLSNDIGLQEKYGSRHVRSGRYILIVAVICGYALGIVRRPHELVIDSLTAILAGFMLYNVFRKELPEIRHARYRPFIAGIGSFFFLHILLTVGH
ncbi:MAG: hypothetical protein KJP23_12410 [Deltaproteobacteria bacterium]|nr:hypothetical protein [Deltaproteobacteria bacterium]